MTDLFINYLFPSKTFKEKHKSLQKKLLAGSLQNKYGGWVWR